MESTFKYRMIQWSWGIAIDLTAEFISRGQFHGEAIEINSDLWLAVKVKGLDCADHEYLARGLKRVVGEIKKHSPVSGPLVVCVKDIWYNPSDYQSEGLVCAIIGWVAHELQFDVPHIPVHFSRRKNRYEFQFENPGNDVQNSAFVAESVQYR